MDLSAVVVSYNSRDHLPGSLGALAASTAGTAAEIVVVDNDSRDGTPDLVRERFPAVSLIRNGANLGYARAVNQGIAATTGRHVLVLNPDCEMKPGALASLARFLDGAPKAAIAAPRILNPDGTLEFSARSFPGPLTFLFNRYSLLTRLFPHNPFSRGYLLTDWDHASVREVDWVSGACMLVRREAIATVGGMDEAFFMFNEDVDWCRRMKLAGHAVCYVPDAVVVHHIGASRRRVAPRVILERHRGMIHYFHKHHPMNPVVRMMADMLILLRAGLMIAANALKLR
jgi:hypothetical protein